jgi:hypothetical protein
LVLAADLLHLPHKAAGVAYLRLTEAPLTEQQRFLLKDCVDAYLPLSDVQRQEMDHLLMSPEMAKVQVMNKTTYEKGMEKAFQISLIRQGKKKFGPPSPEIQMRLQSILDLSLLEDLTERILDVHSWEELLNVPVKP